MQINRMFEIIYLLMNQKTITAKELSERFEVSQRTIYRDIELLCQGGIPIYTTKGKGGGIGLMENFVLNKSVLSTQEQKDILSALQAFKATQFTETDQILSKLSSLFGNQNTDWIEVDFSNWSFKEKDKAKFSLLKDAILNNNVIEFHYYNSYGQESNRIIEPKKLIFKGQAWYLLGYCRSKQDNRYFKISRIKSLQIISENFIPSSGSNKIDTIPEIKNEKMISLVLKVNAKMAFRVFDEFPMEAIQRQEDGNYLIQTNYPDGGWLIGYLMSYEDQIEVIEPMELRNRILDIYKNVIKKY